ncbi:MAG: GntR family transcriptional regulator [Rhodanobacter sp.]
MKQAIVIRSPYRHVMQEIGQRIVSGKLRPGEVLLREEALTESLRVSRTTLRKALKLLSVKSLIESPSGVDVLAWHGAQTPTDDVIDKRVELHEIIAPVVAAAAPRHNRSRLAATDEACKTMDAMIADSRAKLQRSRRRVRGEAAA